MEGCRVGSGEAIAILGQEPLRRSDEHVWTDPNLGMREALLAATVSLDGGRGLASAQSQGCSAFSRSVCELKMVTTQSSGHGGSEALNEPRTEHAVDCIFPHAAPRVGCCWLSTARGKE